MKLSDFLADYYILTGKASDVARQLALAGFAVIWIFKLTDPTGVSRVPSELLGPSLLLGISLALDLVQYLVGSATWGIFHRFHERRKADAAADPDVEASPYLNWPALALFWVKQAALLWAWYYILLYLKRLWLGH